MINRNVSLSLSLRCPSSCSLCILITYTEMTTSFPAQAPSLCVGCSFHLKRDLYFNLKKTKTKPALNVGCVFQALSMDGVFNSQMMTLLFSFLNRKSLAALTRRVALWRWSSLSIPLAACTAAWTRYGLSRFPCSSSFFPCSSVSVRCS